METLKTTTNDTPRPQPRRSGLARCAWRGGLAAIGLVAAGVAGAQGMPAGTPSSTVGPAELSARAVRDGSAAPRGAGASVEMEAVDPGVEAPSGTTARLYRSDATPQATVSTELRTRLWWGNARAGMGGGTDWATAPAGSALRPWRPVVGVRANMGEQARLVYELRGPASPSPALGAAAGDNEARVALEFKSATNPAQNLRNGLFRVQLSNSSSLFLKPRSGGMVVSYRSQF